jgi:hypothetical protein
MVLGAMLVSVGVRFSRDIDAGIELQAAAMDAMEAAYNGKVNGRKALFMGDDAAETPIGIRQNFFLAELHRRGIREAAVSIPGAPVATPLMGGETPGVMEIPIPVGFFGFAQDLSGLKKIGNVFLTLKRLY